MGCWKDDEGIVSVRNRAEQESMIGTLIKWIKFVQKPAAMALAISLILSHETDMAFAANGGRLGGGHFSSDRVASFSGATRAYSASRSNFAFPTSYSAPSPFSGRSLGDIYLGPVYGISLGGGGFFLTLVLGFLGLQLMTGFLSDGGQAEFVAQTQKTSVLKLQVGLLGLARSLQSDLETLADRSDATTVQGLHNVLAETVLALLRHPDFCISATSSSEIKRTSAAGEERFNQLSLEERGKFDEESVISVNNLRRRIISRPRSDRFINEYIVVTLLVAVEGELKLPAINGNVDLKEALTRLGAIPVDQLLAMEVLWTPQDFNDSLSEDELLRDYPLMRSL
ncbi:hypothetical protein O6H91_02G140800 [Diphasiastrum complanatum]|nr:hypothetical protein O6H91_02G140800 [Diphasiastrum complanatum]